MGSKLFLEQMDNNLPLDDDERKRRRVLRIKQAELSTTFDASVFGKSEASDWEKLQ